MMIQYFGTSNYMEYPLTGRLRLWTTGQAQDVSAATATLLLAANIGFKTVPNLYSVLPKAADFILSASDDGVVYNAGSAITVTVPPNLVPRPNVVFIPPPTGGLSFVSSGGAQLNGATTTLTRSRASNPAGVVLTPYTESDGYGLSGA